jgi:thiosulfate/3-mercaptopyruvate sulfurtransferase
MLAPLGDISRADILLDISENVTKHIPGSIAVPYTQFLNGTNLKSGPELAKILGDAGISRQDTVIVYGECMPCGGGPSTATFVYWMLKSLGQENVRVLDGTVKDMEEAGNIVTDETMIKAPKIFESRVDPEYSANYSYVKNGSESGSVQIIDARTIKEFGEGSIPKALNIPDASVIAGNRIKDEAKLGRVFATLDKNKPIVVYTNTSIKASVVWFALKMQGYEAKLYSYENWLTNMKAQSQTTS